GPRDGRSAGAHPARGPHACGGRTPVTLAALLQDSDVRAASGSLDQEVGGIAFDSRRVQPGDVFFALAGTREDGAAYVGQAVVAGAVAGVGGAGPAAPHQAGGVRVPGARARLVLA